MPASRRAWPGLAVFRGKPKGRLAVLYRHGKALPALCGALRGVPPAKRPDGAFAPPRPGPRQTHRRGPCDAGLRAPSQAKPGRPGMADAIRASPGGDAMPGALPRRRSGSEGGWAMLGGGGAPGRCGAMMGLPHIARGRGMPRPHARARMRGRARRRSSGAGWRPREGRHARPCRGAVIPAWPHPCGPSVSKASRCREPATPTRAGSGAWDTGPQATIDRFLA